MKNLFIYTPENTPREEVGLKKSKKEYRVFLAGTIDNGTSENWQREVIEILNPNMVTIGVYNPRRDNWVPNAGHEEVMKQIDWEQRALEKVDHIFMVFLDNSKSPISFLELGMYCRSKKITVFCTKNFYRYDNVLDTCERYGIELVDSTNSSIIARKIMSKAADYATINHS